MICVVSESHGYISLEVLIYKKTFDCIPLAKDPFLRPFYHMSRTASLVNNITSEVSCLLPKIYVSITESEATRHGQPGGRGKSQRGQAWHYKEAWVSGLLPRSCLLPVERPNRT